jgi:hypothetical protein
MKKFLVFILAALVASPLFAGKVKDVNGSVDILQGGKWVKAREGMEIGDSTKIMTGMNSTITIDGKAGTVVVKELSMITYGEKTTAKSVDQKVDLAIGKVRVKFVKARGIQSSFKVQTPKGTASVRGTEKDVFSFPIAGFGVNVVTGAVEVYDANGNVIVSFQGENAGVGGDGELFGDSDLNEDLSGFADQFGDDDTMNDSLDDILDDFLQDLFDYLGEPERL